MKFEIEIEEILRKTIEVDAENASDAKLIVEQLYNDCQIVLTADDFIGSPTIKCINSKE